MALSDAVDTITGGATSICLPSVSPGTDPIIPSVVDFDTTTNGVTWSSSNTAVATIDTDGIVNLKWPREISDNEKLKLKQLMFGTKYESYIVDKGFQPEHIERGLKRTSIVLRLFVTPDII